MNWTLLFFVLYLLSVLLTEAVNDGYEAVKNCNCPPRKNKVYTYFWFPRLFACKRLLCLFCLIAVDTLFVWEYI